MKMSITKHRSFGRLLNACFMLLLPALASFSQAQPTVMAEGRDFATIMPPVATEAAADLIEVVDVFWYGCPVCQEFEPMMTYWGSQIRGDLVMRRMPAVWNEIMKTHARLYFTAVQLELADRAHPAAFRRIHEERQALNNVAQVRTFFADLGVAEADFERVWNSPEVLAALESAEQATTAAGISKLPALVVNGRYRVVRNESVPELTTMIITTNELIRTLREERRLD